MPTRLDKVLDGVNERDCAFYSALQNEDDLGMVVRAHIHIEHEVRSFIKAAAPAPQHLKFCEMDFDATVRLATVLGLHAEYQRPLMHLGSLRNKFSHRLDMKIGDEEANNFYEALGPDAKQAAQHSFAQIQKDEPGKHPNNFRKLPPKDRLLFSLVSLRGGVLIELVRVLGKLDKL